MYYINANNLLPSIPAATIEEAMQIADDGATWQTHSSISIEDEGGNVLMFRPWWGVEFDPAEDPSENPICFGQEGYFGDWVEL